MITRNGAGFRLDDTRALAPLIESTLYSISRTLFHADDANATEAMLRRTRVFCHWVLSAAEAALCNADPEKQTLDALDAELAAIFGERSKDDGRGDLHD